MDEQQKRIDELNQHPNINLSYFSTKAKEWVSVSSSATTSNDRATIRELYEPDWKMWFGGECVIYPKQEKITRRRRERRGRGEPSGPLCVPCALCNSA